MKAAAEDSMRTGDNIRQRADGRFEARYPKGRDEKGRIVYGCCYGKTYEEAAEKRAAITGRSVREMNLLILGAGSHGKEIYELSYEASGGFGIEVNRTRYAELRALGLSAKEAFLATSSVATAEADSRAHLGSSVPRSATRPTMGISQRELKEARELFDGASDAEILRLYRRVSAN